jgi:hypothetical protein
MMLDEKSPISFVVDTRRLPQKGFPLVIELNEAERVALAKAHELVSVDAFRAELLVRDWKKTGVTVTGNVEASITQECIVTLEPVHNAISESIEAVFVPEGSELARTPMTDGEIFLQADGPDGPETFNGHSIDVGALAEEFFGLGIDPYPRKAGAALPTDSTGNDETSPFAKLRDRLPKN